MKRRKVLPAEFWQHLVPVEADFLHADIAAYIFMTSEQLEAEREAIQQATGGGRPGAHSTKPNPEEIASVSAHFGALAPFGHTPTAEHLRETLAPLHGSRIVAFQLELVRRALRHASRYQGQDYDPTNTFAVSPHWRHRWQTLLQGGLFPAYVGFLETGQFWPESDKQ